MPAASSRNVENGLELLHQGPFFHRDVGPVELLQGVDTGTRDARVQVVLLFQVAAVQGLVGTLDLDGNGRLTLFTDRNGLVVTFNRGPAKPILDDDLQK